MGVRIVAGMSTDPTSPPPLTINIISHSPELGELFTALSAAQGEMQTAEMSATNPHFKKPYADLADVWAACRPALTKHGLSVVQLPYHGESGKIGVAAMLGDRKSVV